MSRRSTSRDERRRLHEWFRRSRVEPRAIGRTWGSLRARLLTTLFGCRTRCPANEDDDALDSIVSEDFLFQCVWPGE